MLIYYNFCEKTRRPLRYGRFTLVPKSRFAVSWVFEEVIGEISILGRSEKMAKRHCDKCNLLEVNHGEVLTTTLCVDGLAHHLVENTTSSGTIMWV